MPGRTEARFTPILTYTIIVLNSVLFLWDREGQIMGPSLVFGDLGMRPAELANSLAGDRFPLVTLFTSMFLHASLLHLVSNMVVLAWLGPSVERALGPYRYALYYLAWGLLAGATHTIVDPTSIVAAIGASGAIGGVLGAYFLLFPSEKLDIVILPVDVSAWLLLGLWFVAQVFMTDAGVANWAHVGGFLAGMATVLVMGGRAAVLGRNAGVDEFSGI